MQDYPPLTEKEMLILDLQDVTGVSAPAPTREQEIVRVVNKLNGLLNAVQVGWVYDALFTKGDTP